MRILKAEEVELKGEAPFYFKLDIDKLVKIIDGGHSVISVLTTNPDENAIGCSISTVKTSDLLMDIMFVKNAVQIEKGEYEEIFMSKYKNYIV